MPVGEQLFDERNEGIKKIAGANRMKAQCRKEWVKIPQQRINAVKPKKRVEIVILYRTFIVS